jgi:hypothetical protein
MATRELAVSRKRPRSRYEKTQFAVAALAMPKRLKLLSWLIEDDEHTNVMPHVRRWLHRCAECDEVPRNSDEVEDNLENACKACGSCYCVDDADNAKMPACENARCSLVYDVCTNCREYECDECGDTLCVDCWEDGHLCERCKRSRAVSDSDDGDDGDGSSE